MRSTGKVAIITGAGTGIGKKLCAGITEGRVVGGAGWTPGGTVGKDEGRGKRRG